MAKRAPWVLALLVGAVWCLAGSAEAQPMRRQSREAVIVERTTTSTGPLLAIDTPQEDQTVWGVVTVSGWVLSEGSIDQVLLFIDGSDVPTNRAVLGAPRPDITAAFPSFEGSQATSWITSFLARNLTDGPHHLTIAVTESGVPTPSNFDVDVVVNNANNQVPFGALEVPVTGGTFGASGSLPVTGWALDDSNIDHIDFLVDGSVW